MRAARRQRGFSLVAAVFVIAIALLIVLAAVLTLSARNRSTVQALEASRALFAAQSGVDIARGHHIAQGGVPFAAQAFKAALLAIEEPELDRLQR